MPVSDQPELWTGDEEFLRREEQLNRLQEELAEAELRIRDLQLQLTRFRIEYIRQLGRRIAELDDLLAQIAEARAKGIPDDDILNEVASAARSRARESAAEAASERERGAAEAEEKKEPTEKEQEDLRGLFRDVAKLIHPDLAGSEEDRELRTHLMARANRAYEEGDADELRRLLTAGEEIAEPPGTHSVLQRLHRLDAQIEAANQRLAQLHRSESALWFSEFGRLLEAYTRQRAAGQDFFAEQASDLDARIEGAKSELETLNLLA